MEAPLRAANAAPLFWIATLSLTATVTGFEVADLGSTNGTFLNGRQITRAALSEGDQISIGRHRFVFENQRLQEFIDTGPVSLVADDLMVQIGKAVLLDDISFALPAASLLAAIGEPEMVDTSKDARLGRIFMNRTIRVYPAFSEFYGMEETIERIVGFLRHAAQGLE